MFGMNMSVKGLDGLKLQINEVIQKAEELEQAVQRLNEVEIEISFPTPIQKQIKSSNMSIDLENGTTHFHIISLEAPRF